jgi:uncharacterized protein (DUF302 family)
MDSRTAVVSTRNFAFGAVGWLLAAIAIWVFAAMPTAQAQTSPGAKPAMPALFLEDTSPKPLVPTVGAFEETVRAHGWSMLGVTNMAGILSERGFTIHPVLIFEPCSGKFSADLLGRDETRFVASMIPCRVAIYQTSDGRVVISRVNSVAMADMVGGRAGSVMKQAGLGVEQIIRDTLKRLGS